jgi:hypothetical protein
VSGVQLGGRESDLTIPECGLAIMLTKPFLYFCYEVQPPLAGASQSENGGLKHVQDTLKKVVGGRPGAEVVGGRMKSGQRHVQLGGWCPGTRTSGGESPREERIHLSTSGINPFPTLVCVSWSWS